MKIVPYKMAFVTDFPYCYNNIKQYKVFLFPKIKQNVRRDFMHQKLIGKRSK